jgi:hypothetical protein
MPRRNYKRTASKQPVWQHNGQTFRIIGRCRMVLERGYAEPSEIHYNVLQRRLTNWFHIAWNMDSWVDVEEEEVPAFAWISAATLGSTDWASPLFQRCRETLGLSDISGEGLGLEA